MITESEDNKRTTTLIFPGDRFEINFPATVELVRVNKRTTAVIRYRIPECKECGWPEDQCACSEIVRIELKAEGGLR